MHFPQGGEHNLTPDAWAAHSDFSSYCRAGDKGGSSQSKPSKYYLSQVVKVNIISEKSS